MGVISLVVVGAMLAMLATPVAGQESAGPTEAQLRQAALSLRDIGPGWTEASSGPLVDGIESYGVIFKRETPIYQLLSIGLGDLRTGTPETNALDFVEELSGVRQGEPAELPPYVSDAARYLFQFTKGEFSYAGDVAAWRQGEVVVIVALVTDNRYSCVCEYADLQFDKLAVALR
jgi:hypothetical protein